MAHDPHPPLPGPQGPPSPQDTQGRLPGGGGPDPGALATLGNHPGAERIRAFLEKARAPATRRAYAHHWQSWIGWCRHARRAWLPSPPVTIVEWLEATKWSLAKIEGVIAAIAYAHRLAGYDPPPTGHALVLEALSAVRRDRGRAPKAPKAALVLNELRPLLVRIDRTTLAGKRDAALLLIAWWSALRRSEVVSFELADLERHDGGVSLLLRRSKTDPEGQGHRFGFLEDADETVCPVRALDAWLTASRITSGPIFRGVTRHGTIRKHAIGAQEVARLVKRLAVSAGLPPARFAGHSLRAGFITEGIRQGLPDSVLMGTSRHKSTAMLARYRREADPLRQSAGSMIRSDFAPLPIRKG